MGSDWLSAPDLFAVYVVIVVEWFFLGGLAMLIDYRENSSTERWEIE